MSRTQYPSKVHQQTARCVLVCAYLFLIVVSFGDAKCRRDTHVEERSVDAAATPGAYLRRFVLHYGRSATARTVPLRLTAHYDSATPPPPLMAPKHLQKGRRTLNTKNVKTPPAHHKIGGGVIRSRHTISYPAGNAFRMYQNVQTKPALPIRKKKNVCVRTVRTDGPLRRALYYLSQKKCSLGTVSYTLAQWLVRGISRPDPPPTIHDSFGL